MDTTACHICIKETIKEKEIGDMTGRKKEITNNR